jgi:hydrogenase-4 component F
LALRRIFGTILIYLVAQPVVGEGLPAMAWDTLVKSGAHFDAKLSLAFVFLLVGWHKSTARPAWLPDAC